MTTTCEVNIPQYLSSLGLKPRAVWNSSAKSGYFGYEVKLFSEYDCLPAGRNLPWSFSITKVYQLFLKLVSCVAYYCGCEDTYDWAREQLREIGHDELKNFLKIHIEHKNPNLEKYEDAGDDAFHYFIEPWDDAKHAPRKTTNSVEV